MNHQQSRRGTVKTRIRKKGWEIQIPGAAKARRLKKAKQALKTALVGTAITVSYFGVIALLMSPAFNIA